MKHLFMLLTLYAGPVLALGSQPNLCPITSCPKYTRGPILCSCIPLARGASTYFDAFPKFMPTHVIYAPPGKGSSIQYESGDTVGTTISLTKSFKNTTTVTVGQRQDFIFANYHWSVEMGNMWGNSRTDATDIAITQTQAIRKLGWQDGIDHDDDEIWMLLGPVFNFEFLPEWFSGPAEFRWSLASNEMTRPFFMYAGELRGTRPISPAVWDTLNRYGISQADFKEMLKADPLVGIGDTSAMVMDRRRWELVGSFPYRPAPGPNLPATTQTLTIRRRSTASITEGSEDTFSLKVSFGIGGPQATMGLGGISGFYFDVSDQIALTQSSSTKNTTEQNVAATLVLTQPPFDYRGPTVVNVWLDKVRKAYAYTLDWTGVPQ